MTTDTFPLPSTYAYGKVVGRIIYAIGDTAEDADDKPQARAAAGTVTFTPMATGAKVTTADYTAIVMNGAVKANLSSSGRILDAEGRQGIWLIQGIYRVDFSFTATSDGLRGSLPPFQIEVLPAHTDLAPLDLASAAPASVPEGAVVQTIVLPTGSGIMSRNALTGAIEYIDPEDLGGGASVLSDLDDVDTADAANGEALIKVSGGYKFGPVASTVDGLSDASTVGKAVVKATDAAAARSAIGAVADNDTRLTDARTPSDNSVTNAKVAAGAGISADKLADGTTLKVLTATERTKLTGIATGATANDTDANLKARGNHTGTQAASTITGLAAVATSGSASDITTGTLPTSVLPPLAINETFVVASQAAMLALTAQRGDMAIRSDNGKTYVLSSDSPSTLADWKEILAAGQVQSVAGKTGVVALVAADVSDFASAALTAAPAETAASVGTLVAAASAKAPVDADMLALADSAASNVVKKLTWASLKTALGSVFAAASHNHDASAVNAGTLDAARMPTSLSFDVWQASGGTWPSRPTVPTGARVNWIGYPGLTDLPAGFTSGTDSYMMRTA